MEEVVGSTPISSTTIATNFGRLHDMKHSLQAKLSLRFFTSLLLIFTFFPTVSCAQADNKDKTKDLEVMVLISYKGFLGDMGSIVYSDEIENKKAQADLKRLMDSLGWRATDIKITAEGEMQSGEDKPMTAVDFIHWGYIDLESGRLPVEAIISAFKEYGQIEILFMLPQSFIYTGVKQYEDEHVKLIYEDGGDIKRFTVLIKNSDFDILVLPVPEEKAQPVADQNKGANITAILLVILLAILLASIAYIVVRSLSIRKGQNKT